MSSARNVVPFRPSVNATLPDEELHWQQHGEGVLANWNYSRVPTVVLSRLMSMYPSPEEWKVCAYFFARIYGCDVTAMRWGAPGTLREIAAAIDEEESLGTVQRALKRLVDDYKVLVKFPHPNKPQTFVYHFRDPNFWVYPDEKPRRRPYYRRSRGAEGAAFLKHVEQLGYSEAEALEVLAAHKAREAEDEGEVSRAVEVLAAASQERQELAENAHALPELPGYVNVVALPVERVKACLDHPSAQPPSAIANPAPKEPVDNSRTASEGLSPRSASSGSASGRPLLIGSKTPPRKGFWDVHSLYVRRGSGRSYVATTLVDACSQILDGINLDPTGRRSPLPEGGIALRRRGWRPLEPRRRSH